MGIKLTFTTKYNYSKIIENGYKRYKKYVT